MQLTDNQVEYGEKFARKLKRQTRVISFLFLVKKKAHISFFNALIILL